jgi:PAS domain S-box-containing protein
MRSAGGEITGLVGIGRNVTERKQAEEALRASEASLKFSQRVAHVGHWTWDTLANRVTWSDEMFRIFGLDPNGFDGDLSKIIEQAIHPDDREKVNQSNAAVIMEQKPQPIEYRILWPDQSVHTVWAEAGERVLDEQGNIIKLSGIVQDITERKRAEEGVQKSLREKETLLREVYHRTKNNMAVMIALLSLQADTFDDPRLKEAFAEAQDRIRSMALVHQKLYDAQDLSRLNLKEYIQDLVHLLIASYQILPTRIRLILEMEDVFVLIDTAIPLGLILSELLSNTFKYAFPDNREGEIRVQLRRTSDGTIHLVVEDNGVGVAEDYDFRQAGHLGTQNIFLLGESQLQGQVVFETHRQGVACRLQFKDIYYNQRV